MLCFLYDMESNWTWGILVILLIAHSDHLRYIYICFTPFYICGLMVAVSAPHARIFLGCMKDYTLARV